MGKSRIAILEDPLDPRPQHLARDLGLPLAGAGQADMLLAFAGPRLEVHLDGTKPLWVDFLGADMNRRCQSGRRNHPLARAVGRKQPLPRVVDATAGLGRDAYVLASLGYEVVAVERCPILHAMLSNGLARAVGTEASKRIRLIAGDAQHYLASLEAMWLPDVVYMDPMFPKRTKSALVKKEMQFFQRLLLWQGDGDRNGNGERNENGNAPASKAEGEDDAGSLFDTARCMARQRVVVKRPAKAPPLAGKPSYRVQGGRVRWDVYLLPQAPRP